MSQHNETAAMLVSQSNPVGVETFLMWKTFFCSNKFTKLMARWVKPLYSLFHPGLVLRNDLFNKKKIIFYPLNSFLDFLTSFLWSTKYLFKKDKHFAWSLPYRPQKWWQMKMFITQVRLLFPPQSFGQFCFHFFLRSQDNFYCDRWR